MQTIKSHIQKKKKNDIEGVLSTWKYLMKQ